MLDKRLLAAAVVGALCVSVAGATSTAAAATTSTAAQVADDAAWIRSAQLPDGAIAWYSDRQHIDPYLANYAAIGLAEAYRVTGNQADLSAATSWLQWYAAHEDPTGVVTDYDVAADGTETSTGDEDSTDAYAGTFLLATQALWRAGVPTATLHSLAAGVRGAVAAIESTQDADGLTWAKPTWHVKYLMDQSEAYAGLKAAVALASPTGQRGLGPAWSTAESAMASGIDGLWDPATGAYDWARHDDGTQVVTDWTQLYSDSMEQAWASALAAMPSGRAGSLIGTVTADHPLWDSPTSTDLVNGAQQTVGYWPLAGWALLKAGRTQDAATAATSIRSAATAAGRAWPWTTGNAGQLIVLESGDLSLVR